MSEASQKKILDFDVSNMSISEFWVRLLETDYFFHSAIEQDYFFQPKSEQGNFFRKKSKHPPSRISNGPCLSASGMKTVLVRYGNYVRTKRDEKSLNETHTESRDIDEYKIIQ